MNENIRKKKKEIRHLIQHARDALSKKERNVKSLVIANTLLSQEFYKSADKIFIYYPFRSEVNTLYIIKEAQKAGKEIILPKVEDDRLRLYYVKDLKTDLFEGSFGITEPGAKCREALLEDMDLIILPGTCFDKKMNRIGYGGGFYDRVLDRIPANITKIALAFDLQILDLIPTGEFDKKVDLIITESRIYYP